MMKKVFVFLFLFVMMSSFVLAANSGIALFRDRPNDVLDQSVEFPEEIKSITRVAFGLDEDHNVDLQVFIVLLGIWIVMLLIVKSILDIVPFFGVGWKSWIGGIVVTLLMATTGALRISAEFFFSIGTSIKVLGDWGIAVILFTLVILFIILYAVTKVTNILKYNMGLEEIKKFGYNLALEKARAKAIADSMNQN